jgi:tetratricopeptide (TPR) repeat protein
VDDRNKRAAECFRRGNEATEKKNWDLAIAMYGGAAKMAPDNLTYRQLLRATTRKKFNDNGTGAGMLAKTKLMSIRSRISSSKKKADWADVDLACEEGLQLNPWDVHLLVEHAEAAIALNRLEIARESYRLACLGDKPNKDLHKKFADLLEKRAEYDEAIKVWEHIYSLDKLDGEARSKISALGAAKVTHRGGYTDAESTKDVKVNQGGEKKTTTAYSDYDLKRGGASEGLAPGDSMENDLRQMIRKEPENLAHYTKLGAYYRKNKQFDEAHEILSKALQISGNSPDMREQVEDVELDRMRMNIELGKEKASKSENPKDRENVAALAQELLKREIEVLSSRVERYPQDMNKKLELASRFMRLQKWVQAIPLLQRATGDPRLKAKAFLQLGKCFMGDNKWPLARGQFERSIPDLDFNVDPDSFKEGHYYLARVAEKLGDRATAEKHYGEVLVVDYEYKDTCKRLEELQGGSGAPASIE